MSIAQRIIEARTRKGWSQATLAARLNLTRAAVSLWELGRSEPSRENVTALAQQLDVTVDFLLGGTPMRLTSPPAGTQFGERDLPVLGAALGGHGALVLNSGAAHEYVERPPGLVGVKDAFAVYMTGDSMEPRFEAGEVLYVHPTKPPSPRDYVLVEMDDTQAYVKRLVRMTGEEIIAEQFNPRQEVRYPRASVRRVYKIHGLWAK